MFLTHQNPNIPCWPSNSILKNTYACRVSRSARDREKSQSSYVKVRGVKDTHADQYVIHAFEVMVCYQFMVGISTISPRISVTPFYSPREEYAGKILVRVKG
ncbi:hypothetical protein TWF225_009632 [Orbilia oligospora]|nr:hypothetical protein TWF751_009610 [Orbilia oligospora]KAF3173833.1 hypothetical protein TWF225_009632 [Orbilia oligospora]KAF3244406.1 hypothetical protein TWF128_009785 [Orbilia oligospora]KAF3247146.1 hypothetical protein TWF217_009793 [Orbilia oligospora]KAF3280709.1 hypothetical protein TWF132_011457 [Orbilia oligospora]